MADSTVDKDSFDPSGTTAAFRAFTQAPPEPAAASRTPLIVGGAVVAVMVVAILLWSLIR